MRGMFYIISCSIESNFTITFMIGAGRARAEQRPIEMHGNEYLKKLRPSVRSRVDSVQYKGWHSAG